MKLMRYSAWVAVLLACLLSQPASALTIQPTYTTEGTVSEFPEWAKTRFEYAADKWDTDWIASSGSTTDADTFYLEVRWSNLLGPSMLAESSPVFKTDSELTYQYLTAQYKVLFDNELIDVNEGHITFNSNSNWYQGTDASPGETEYDFVTVALQELGHQLGMTDTHAALLDTWGVDAKLGYYDDFLRDESGNRPTAGAGGGDPSNFDETDDPVYFVGANATAAYGGNVPIYAPSPTVIPGVSLMHLNDAGYLMSYGIGPGDAVHTLSDVEWGIFEDLGWTMTPEPTTAAFALLAAGAAIWVRRRRKASP